MSDELQYNHTIKERLDLEKNAFPPVHAPNYKGNKKLAICGLAATTRDAAPFDDPAFDIWSVHMGAFLLRRVDVLFEFHDPAVFKKPEYADKAYYDRLKTIQIPVFMQRHYEDIPTSIEYPIKEIQQEFGNFFTNSISYMLALAFRNQYEEVHVFGVEMEHGTEYVDQARSVIFFTGILLGRGVKVFYPPVCQLFKNRYLYGFETAQQDEDVQKMEAHRAELNQQLAEVQNQHGALTQRMFRLQGAIEENELLNKRILMTDPH
jgi:hypothetical protein